MRQPGCIPWLSFPVLSLLCEGVVTFGGCVPYIHMVAEVVSLRLETEDDFHLLTVLEGRENLAQ